MLLQARHLTKRFPGPLALDGVGFGLRAGETAQGRAARVPDGEVLRAEGLGRRGRVAPFDLPVRAGEVIGVAGLLGSGRTETAKVMFGAAPAEGGTVRNAMGPVDLSSPARAVAAGLGFAPEARKTCGIIGELSVREDVALALQAHRGWARPLPRAEARRLAEHCIRRLDIRTPGPEKPAGLLSGGNRQTVILARWLAVNPRFLILDEPTRGLDVGAWAWIVAGLVVALVVRRRALGFLVEPVGVNLRASRLAGVNGTALLLTVYAISGLCAAVAGLVVTGDIQGADASNAGLWPELDAILAVTIGGTLHLGGRFSIIASLVGAMVIRSINTGILLAGFPPEINLVVKAALALLILALRSPHLGVLAANLAARPHSAEARGGDPAMSRRRLPLCGTNAIFVLAYAFCWLRFPNILSTRVVGTS